MSPTSPHPKRILLPLVALLATLLILAAPAFTGQARADGVVDRSLTALQQQHQLSKHRARHAKRIYRRAFLLSSKLNRPIKGRSKRARARRRAIMPRRKAMLWQVRMVREMADRGLITADRIAPLFTTLDHNTRWFKRNGPAPAATDRRFKGSRIIFQYFPGTGWQFHPLSNFAKLNAVWTVDTPPSRRAQREYSRELVRWGVRRGSALVWEYYFDFQGSSAPWISSISQGTAAQSLARVAYRMRNRRIMRAARLASRSFLQEPTRGLRVERDGGFHFLGYSGKPKFIVLNMFLQSLNGLRSYSLLAKDERMYGIYKRGVRAAEVETPQFDTGSWSLYSLGGKRTNLHYHLLTIRFLKPLCKNTRASAFCKTRKRFLSYLR
jgi:hypothetical protein